MPLVYHVVVAGVDSGNGTGEKFSLETVSVENWVFDEWFFFRKSVCFLWKISMFHWKPKKLNFRSFFKMKSWHSLWNPRHPILSPALSGKAMISLAHERGVHSELDPAFIEVNGAKLSSTSVDAGLGPGGTFYSWFSFHFHNEHTFSLPDQIFQWISTRPLFTPAVSHMWLFTNASFLTTVCTCKCIFSPHVNDCECNIRGRLWKCVSQHLCIHVP